MKVNVHASTVIGVDECYVQLQTDRVTKTPG